MHVTKDSSHFKIRVTIVKTLNMLLHTVGIVIMLLASALGGYKYQVPNDSLELPLQSSASHHDGDAYRQYFSAYEPQSHISAYSVSQADYQYLNQQKNSQYDARINLNREPDTTPHNNEYQSVHYAYANGNSGQFSHGNGLSGNTFSSQSVVQQNAGVNFNNAYSSYSSHAVEPVVTKHFYFHVPPPDVQEQAEVIPALPPKKVYNIVFIKVPSQARSRLASLQHLASQQAAAVQDKTLIYVLVKKPEPPRPQVAPPVNSGHEVFYVKYKGNPDNIATQINGQLAQLDDGPVLEPGLLNGRL